VRANGRATYAPAIEFQTVPRLCILEIVDCAVYLLFFCFSSVVLLVVIIMRLEIIVYYIRPILI
jgi:hypothetical protein